MTKKIYSMTQREIDEMIRILVEHRKKVTSSKEAAREFLDSFGLLTPKGKLKKRFRPYFNVSR